MCQCMMSTMTLASVISSVNDTLVQYKWLCLQGVSAACLTPTSCVLHVIATGRNIRPSSRTPTLGDETASQWVGGGTLLTLFQGFSKKNQDKHRL